MGKAHKAKLRSRFPGCVIAQGGQRAPGLAGSAWISQLTTTYLGIVSGHGVCIVLVRYSQARRICFFLKVEGAGWPSVVHHLHPDSNYPVGAHHAIHGPSTCTTVHLSTFQGWEGLQAVHPFLPQDYKGKEAPEVTLHTSR